MADWPREIKPEDRVKYLVNARAAIYRMEWDGLVAYTEHDERLWIAEEDGIFDAMYSSDSVFDILVGEYDTSHEAKKALIDYVVVRWAVRQAWEDLAT